MSTLLSYVDQYTGEKLSYEEVLEHWNSAHHDELFNLSTVSLAQWLEDNYETVLETE